MQVFCNNKLFFLLSVLSCKCFLVGFKSASEQPVPEHVQRKEHVFPGIDAWIDLVFE